MGDYCEQEGERIDAGIDANTRALEPGLANEDGLKEILGRLKCAWKETLGKIEIDVHNVRRCLLVGFVQERRQARQERVEDHAGRPAQSKERCKSLPPSPEISPYQISVL